MFTLHVLVAVATPLIRSLCFAITAKPNWCDDEGGYRLAFCAEGLNQRVSSKGLNFASLGITLNLLAHSLCGQSPRETVKMEVDLSGVTTSPQVTCATSERTPVLESSGGRVFQDQNSLANPLPRIGQKKMLRRIMNRILAKVARNVPGARSVRPWLHRLRGVDIDGHVFIGDDVYLENEYPERVRLEDGVQIGLRSTIVAHTRHCGQVNIRKNAFIGPCSVIISAAETSLTIGEGAVVSAGSVITTNIPPATMVRPARVKACARVAVPFTYETSYKDFCKGLRPVATARKRPAIATKSTVEVPAPAGNETGNVTPQGNCI